MKPQLTIDQHMKAFQWLESNLFNAAFEYDLDEILAMEEQVQAKKWKLAR